MSKTFSVKLQVQTMSKTLSVELKVQTMSKTFSVELQVQTMSETFSVKPFGGGVWPFRHSGVHPRMTRGLCWTGEGLFWNPGALLDQRLPEALPRGTASGVASPEALPRGTASRAPSRGTASSTASGEGFDQVRIHGDHHAQEIVK